MQLRVLGPLEVWENGQRLALGGPRHRRLLAALILRANRVVAVDHLADVLWRGEPPSSAAASIHVRVSELRKALSVAGGLSHTSPILTSDRGYRLQVDAEALDVVQFQELATSGHRALTSSYLEAAVDTLHEALALWRGAPYADLDGDPDAGAEAVRLAALRTSVEDDVLEARMQRGEHSGVAAELTSLVVQTPWAERRWAQLMLAHYRCGRQGEALVVFATARRRLVDELGVEPGAELRQMHQDILRQAAHLDWNPVTLEPASHIPAAQLSIPTRLDAFVGRTADLASAEQSLLEARIVTVTGPGGVGKTSLAREVATRSAGRYSDGVWFIELASIADPELVATTIAARLGVKAQPQSDVVTQIADRLSDAACLVVLDNCEHVLSTVADLVSQLLQWTVRPRILTTSRERLGISGERVHPLAGLGLPAYGHDHVPADVGSSEAVQLWVERAVAVRADFDLDEQAAPHVARICRRLDGLPLALELSAAAISALDVDQIAARLDDRLELLDTERPGSPGRHGSLRAVVDWSYARLASSEQRVFEQISAFQGSFPLVAAEEVCRLDGERTSVAALLWRLVDTSLLTSESSGGSRRYRLLDVIREHASRRLHERGETAVVRRRHASHFLGLAVTAGAALHGPDQAYWVAVLEREHDNLRAAMEWFLENDETDAATQLAGSIYAFWDRGGHYAEGRRWLSRALALPAGADPGPRGRALMGSATLAVIQGDLRSAETICAEVIQLSREHADYETLAHALQFCGLAAIFADDLVVADHVIGESLRAARFSGQVWLEGWGLEFQAAIALARGSYDQVVELADQSVQVSRPSGDPECVAWALVTAATASIAQGRLAAAVPALRECLDAFRELGGGWGLSLAVFDCAQLAEHGGDAATATYLLAASEQLRVAARAGVLPSIRPAYDACAAACIAALEAKAHAAAWMQGRDAPIHQTLTRAAEVLARSTVS